MILRLALVVVLALSAVTAEAQSGRRQDGARGDRQQTSRDRQMSQEDRQRMRDDVREAYRQRQDRPQRQQMSPEERGKLRRDIEDANRELKR
jgi:hypothetical protein